MTSYDIGPPDGDAEIRALGEILGQSLGFPPNDEFDWVSPMGKGNLRVARAAGRVAGGLMLPKMAQWFGGRSVEMVGIHGVGVAPEFRGRGVGLALMRETVGELHARGVPLSVLYPATQPIYRAAGYEQAGVRNRYRVPVSSFDVKNRSLDLRPVEPSDHEAIKQIYRRRAETNPGNIDRSEWGWGRTFASWRGKVYGYVASRGVEIEGYIFFMQTSTADHFYDIDIIDWTALTADAGKRLLGLLCDHRSMACDVTWFGPPADPMLFHLREERHAYDFAMNWMLRIVDVPKALVARGYGQDPQAGLTRELILDVTDNVVPENRGRYKLTVSGGVGDVQRLVGPSPSTGGTSGTGKTGGRAPVLTLDVRGLAAMYSGFLSPHALSAIGLLDGDESALRCAAELFTGATPWMSEIF